MKKLWLKLWRWLNPYRCDFPCVFQTRSPQAMGRHKKRCVVRQAVARAAEAIRAG